MNLQNLIDNQLPRTKTLSALCCIVALNGLLAIAPAQAVTQEQMQILQQMSPEQQAALMQQYGGGAQSHSKPSPISNAPAAQPRQVGAGRLEADVKDTSADEKLTSQEVLQAPKVDVPLAEINSQQDADKLEVRRSFEDFMREAKPLEVGTSGLQQFGYDLFASEPSTFAPVTDIPVPPEYVLGPGDEVKVQLYGGQNTQLALTVDREGAVSFPQIGPISVAGLSFAQAKALLAEQIKQKMIGVSASITMGQLRSIRIFALGDVHRPGSYTVSGLATLSSALFASGGVKKIGSLRNIELKRNGRKVTTIDLSAFLLRGDTRKDVRLLPGDVVFVPTIGKTISIAGEVIRPAIYEIRNENTVADIIKLAGGLMPKAYLEKALIERIDSKGEQKVINLTLHDNGAGTAIQSGDVIKVFAGTEFENNQIMLTGNLKRPGKYAWEQGMRVSSLIASLDDLLPETFLDYGVIEREAQDTREPMLLRFKLGELLNPKAKGGEIDLALQARDRIYVFKRASFREQPKISVAGSVQNPGAYEHKRNMRLADLILAAGGLKRDTDFEFVEIYRTDPQTREVQLIKANLSKAMSGDAASDVALQDLDRVVVHSIFERKERAQVSVYGEVNNPGVIDLGSGMRISDVIFASGNITEMAYLQNAEITRYSIENGIKRVSSHFKVNLEAALKGDPQANEVLQPYDVLNIRRISNWRTAEKVEVKGEVLHPGNYPVEEGETLSSLLQRVGGFTDKAYLQAAVFTRESIRAEQQREMDEMASRIESEISIMGTNASQTRDDILRNRQAAALDASRRLLSQLKSAKATGRMVIALSDIEALKGTSYDVQLRDGDRLIVPKQPNEVLVVGDVYNRSALLHNPDYDLDDYIEEAGPTRTADLDSAYIVRADGRIEMQGGWFANNDLDPGDTIVVPPNLERGLLLDSLLDWGRAMSQIAITLAAMKSIGAI